MNTWKHFEILKGFFFRINRVAFVFSLLFVGLFTAAGSIVFFYDSILSLQVPDSPLKENNIAVAIFMSCFLGPVLETQLFIVWPFKFATTSLFLRNKLVYVIIISSLLFAILHVNLTSVIYIFPHFFLTCMIWFFGYVSRVEKDKYTFWLVVLSHSIYNLVTVIGEFYY